MKQAVQNRAQHERPSWDEYFLGIVHSVGARATCDRGGSGCVITKDNRILSTGYLGSASGLPHCDEAGHDIKSDQCIRTIHAEHNAITQAMKSGISLEGATMYCNLSPCKECASLASNLGITRVVIENKI